MPTSPLKDAASGGELSRIMLALSGLAGGDAQRTLVFDEIDAGVGGNTARAVGERLRAIASGQQVLCITHLPQVASLAATHFVIDKDAADGETRATVERVSGDELVGEIVRMLGGESGDAAASRHAKQLLKAA
jgi:DNA repair protein RecN (Recombination protein N)